MSQTVARGDVPDIRGDQHPVDQGDEHGVDRDTDQNQSKSFDPSAPGEEVDRRGGQDPPDIAASGNPIVVPSTVDPPKMITPTAPALAPAVIPRRSGLASGFRVIDWVYRTG